MIKFFLTPVLGAVLLSACGAPKAEVPVWPRPCLAGIVETGPGRFQADIIAQGELRRQDDIGAGTVEYITSNFPACGESVS